MLFEDKHEVLFENVTTDESLKIVTDNTYEKINPLLKIYNSSFNNIVGSGNLENGISYVDDFALFSLEVKNRQRKSSSACEYDYKGEG